MIVGFTGTRNGMTEAQQRTFLHQMNNLKPERFLFGDCVGSDYIASLIAFHCGIPERVSHPPINKSLRAFSKYATLVMPEKEYLARNRDIVDSADLLIATVLQFTDHPRSGGTWYTIRYAIKKGVPVTVIWPDGEIGDGR